MLVLIFSGLLVLFSGLLDPLNNQIEQQILLQLRLPLVLTACLVGAALSVSSASLQVLLHNPLADPGIIGITSGASLCAALFLLLGTGLSPDIIQYLLPLPGYIFFLMPNQCVISPFG